MLLCLYVSLSFFTLVAARALRVGTFNIKYDPNPPTPSYSTVSSYSQTTTATASSSLKPSSSPSALSFVRAVRGAEPSALKRDTQNSQQKPWADRREPLVKQILFEELDIFGLQEVLHNQLEDIRSLLGDEYQCIGVGRDDGKTKGEAVSPISFQVTTVRSTSLTLSVLQPLLSYTIRSRSAFAKNTLLQRKLNISGFLTHLTNLAPLLGTTSVQALLEWSAASDLSTCFRTRFAWPQ